MKPRTNTKKGFVILGTAVAIAALAVVAIVSTSVQGDKEEPLPVLAAVYEGKEYPLGLQAYSWNGTFAPGPNARLPYPDNPINVTRGASIEFITKKAAQQPSYYQVSVESIELAEANKDALIIENERLDKNQLLVDFDEGRYLVRVAAFWVDVDLFGQHYRNLAYAQVINVE